MFNYGFRFYITGQRDDGKFGIKDTNDLITQFYSYEDTIEISKKISIMGVSKDGHISTDWFKGYLAKISMMLGINSQEFVKMNGVVYIDNTVHPCFYYETAKNGSEYRKHNSIFVEFIESTVFYENYKGHINKSIYGASKPPFKSGLMNSIHNGVGLKFLKPATSVERIGSFDSVISSPLVIKKYELGRTVCINSKGDIIVDNNFICRGKDYISIDLHGKRIIINSLSSFNTGDTIVLGDTPGFELYFSMSAINEIYTKCIRVFIRYSPVAITFEDEFEINDFFVNGVIINKVGDFNNIKIFYGSFDGSELRYTSLDIPKYYHYIRPYDGDNRVVKINETSLGFWFANKPSEETKPFIKIGKRFLAKITSDFNFEKKHNIRVTDFMRLVK